MTVSKAKPRVTSLAAGPVVDVDRVGRRGSRPPGAAGTRGQDGERCEHGPLRVLEHTQGAPPCPPGVL